MIARLDKTAGLGAARGRNSHGGCAQHKSHDGDLAHHDVACAGAGRQVTLPEKVTRRSSLVIGQTGRNDVSSLPSHFIIYHTSRGVIREPPQRYRAHFFAQPSLLRGNSLPANAVPFARSTVLRKRGLPLLFAFAPATFFFLSIFEGGWSCRLRQVTACRRHSRG